MRFTLSFFCLMSLSIMRLFPMVPTMMSPFFNPSIFPFFNSSILTGLAVPQTLRTSSPRLLAARITPFQSCPSTTISTVLPSLAIQNFLSCAVTLIAMTSNIEHIVSIFFIFPEIIFEKQIPSSQNQHSLHFLKAYVRIFQGARHRSHRWSRC